MSKNIISLQIPHFTAKTGQYMLSATHNHLQNFYIFESLEKP